MSTHTRSICLITGACGALASALSAAPPSFVDSTASAGVAAIHQSSGYTHWDYTGGGSVGDFNNDGWQDLFVIAGQGLDHLFINNHDGTFTDQAQSWGLLAHQGKGAAVGDFNNDGFLDLFVTSAGSLAIVSEGQHKLYRNNGDNTFTEIAAAAGVNFTTPVGEDGFGATFGDYDLDGDLDLFVAGFGANNSGNHLFRNNGDETFTDVTIASGLFSTTPGLKSFSPRLVDMDGDFYPELLIASDFTTRSRCFKNNGDGTFTDITFAANLGQDENGMGQTVGDYNNDGLLDWYVTSIYLPSIGWTGNKLYTNLGGDLFTENSAAAGVSDGGYGWGAVSVDFNNDGLLDIAETNGDSGNFGGTFFGEQSYLWMNNGDGSFTESAIVAGMAHFGKGRGMVNFDADNDGDQDVVILTNNEPLAFFRNTLIESGTANAHWVRVLLDTTGSPTLAPNGFGARVFVTVNIHGSPQTLLRIIAPGDNFESSSEISAPFGLGGASVITQLRVDWPNGTSTVMANVPADQTITIHAVTNIADLNGDGVVNSADLASLLSVWGACPPAGACAADLNADGAVNAADLANLLANWG